MGARERMTKLHKHGDISGLGARIKILRCDGGVVFPPLEFGLKIFGFT